VFITFARGVPDIFFSLIFSCLANLVYPALSSLVSRSAPLVRQPPPADASSDFNFES
jgi:hypothetical protein